MYTYADMAPEMPLVALGVVIWVVAISIAFGFYIPGLRASPRVAPSRQGGFAPAAPSLRTIGDAQAAMADLNPAPVEAAPRAPVLAVVEPAGQAPPAVAAPDVFTVLIVDDNAINRRVLELILDSVGVAHVSVENGLEAVQAMEVCPYQAVLMDLQMPTMDGLEATRRIRALQARRGDARSAIIVVSANCFDEDVAAGRAAGADSHLAKPISASTLLSELASRSGAQMAA